MCGMLLTLPTEGGGNYIKEERPGGIKIVQNLLRGNMSNSNHGQCRGSNAIKWKQRKKLAKCP